MLRGWPVQGRWVASSLVLDKYWCRFTDKKRTFRPLFIVIEISDTEKSLRLSEFTHSLDLARAAAAAFAEALAEYPCAAWLWLESPTLRSQPWFHQYESLTPETSSPSLLAKIAGHAIKAESFIEPVDSANPRAALLCPGVIAVNSKQFQLAHLLNQQRERLAQAYQQLVGPGVFVDKDGSREPLSSLRKQILISKKATRWNAIQATRTLPLLNYVPSKIAFTWTSSTLIYRHTGDEILAMLNKSARYYDVDALRRDVDLMNGLLRSRPAAKYAYRRVVHPQLKVNISEHPLDHEHSGRRYSFRHASLPILILGNTLPPISAPRPRPDASHKRTRRSVKFKASGNTRLPLKQTPLLETLPIYEYCT